MSLLFGDELIVDPTNNFYPQFCSLQDLTQNVKQH